MEREGRVNGRVAEVLEIAGVSAYLLGAAAYLRARGRLAPTVSLPRLALRAARVRVGRLVGPVSGSLTAIQPVAGHAYLARLPLLFPEPSDEEGTSRLVLLEEGRPLGPAHAAHVQVQGQGLGRYSHWRGYVVFSSSDNTDPRANGRRYEFRIGE